jgi:hypothetical protein
MTYAKLGLESLLSLKSSTSGGGGEYEADQAIHWWLTAQYLRLVRAREARAVLFG